MSNATIPKACGLWLAILVLAFVNGTLREVFLIPILGKTPGLVLSGILLSIAVLAVAWLGAPRLGSLRGGTWWGLGFLWLVLTVGFEFGFGILGNKAWSEMLAPYSFRDGNIWSLVLAVVFLAPRWAARRRGLDRVGTGFPVGGKNAASE